jgi:AcrR family transcriptional regulator
MMENVVLDSPSAGSVAERTAVRSVATRYEASASEVRRLVDAAYAVMRRTGTCDPRVGDIVAEAGLSNQAFYRHFQGKDELLLAVLDDGRRRLVGYLEHRLGRAAPGEAQVREWVRGVMEQARNPEAAGNTRPFAIDAARLADRFPEEMAASRELVLAPLRAAVGAAGGDPRRDADAIYHLVVGTMNDALVHHEHPSSTDIDHLVEFALNAIAH